MMKKHLLSFIVLFLLTHAIKAQTISLLTEPLENRISDIVVYGQVTGDNIPGSVSLKINDDIYNVAVNDTGMFMQAYTLHEGINEVSAALDEDGLSFPLDKQNLKFIDYKLPFVSIEGNIIGTAINLSASGTSPVGSGLNYKWTTGENNPAELVLSATSGTDISFLRPSVNGEYYIYCTATDIDGRSYRAGRFLRVDSEKCYLNNENMHSVWADSIMIYEYQLFRFPYEELPFERISEKFHHIKQLGANAIWHTPPIKGGGGNYHPNNYYLIDPEYGTNNDYKRFVDKAHEAGLKVIFDIPVGHTNSNHCFLNNVYALKEYSPYKDYYYWAGEPGNSQVTYSPDNGENCVYTNIGNNDFKEYLLKVLEYWVREYGIDGFRYDCGQEIFNRDSYFLQEAQRRLRNIKPDIVLFIEGNYDENPEYLSVADICYDWRLFAWGSLNGFRGIFDGNISIDSFHQDYMQAFADSTLPLRYCNTGYFLPVHETWDMEREKTGHIIAFTGYGTSLIYAGTEVGSPSGPIDWEDELNLYPFYRKLIRVKKDILGNYPELRRLDNTTSDAVYSYLSKNKENRIIVVANLSPDAQTTQVNLNVPEINTLTNYYFQDLINNTGSELSQTSLSEVAVSLKAWETRMFWIGDAANDLEKKVESVNINNTSLAIETHQGCLQLKYNVLPEYALDKRIQWAIDDNEMAIISESGLLRASGKKNGTLNVTATALDGSGVSETVQISISNQQNYHNLIANPSFNEYLDYWQLTYYSGIAEFDINDQQVNINIEESAVNQWDINLAQPFIIVEPNTEYILSFDAKAGSDKTILCSLTNVIWQDINITSSWKTYSIPFTTTDEVQLQLMLMLGNITGEFSFDNFSIIEKQDHETRSITFRVDMQNETVSPEGVFLRGTFNNWSGNTPMQNEGTVYYTSVDLLTGEKVEYKFVNGDQWEEGIPEECAVGPTCNRELLVPETNTSLDVVCFNSCTACWQNETYNITLACYPDEGGVVTGAGSYNGGDEVILTAISNAGYEFINWTVDGAELSTDSYFTLTATQNLHIKANFGNTTGIGDLNLSESAIAVYPNPAKDIIELSGLPDDNKLIFRLFNSEGILLFEQVHKNTGKAVIDLSKFQQGSYYLKITGNKTFRTTKILKL